MRVALFGIAITPNGQYAYVVNSCDGTVSVIDTAINTVLPASTATTEDSNFPVQWLIIPVLAILIVILLVVILVRKKLGDGNHEESNPKRNNNRTIFLVLFVSAVLLAGIARFNIGQASAPIALQQNQNLTVIPPSDGNALSTSPSVSWLPFTPQSSSGNNISLFDITYRPCRCRCRYRHSCVCCI